MKEIPKCLQTSYLPYAVEICRYSDEHYELICSCELVARFKTFDAVFEYYAKEFHICLTKKKS